MNKYVGSFVGDGREKIFEITHNLGTMDLVFMARGDNEVENRYYHDLYCIVRSVNENVLRFTFKEPLDINEKLIVTVIG